MVRTEILEVLTEALGLDPEPPTAPRGVRRGFRAAVGRVLGAIAAAGREPLPAPRAEPTPPPLPPAAEPEPGPPPEGGFAPRQRPFRYAEGLLEAESRLEALSGRLERVRRALAAQEELVREPPSPEAAEGLLLAMSELAAGMRRVAEEMRQERERVVRQVLELTEALRSVHLQLQELRALPAGVGSAPEAGPPPVPPEPEPAEYLPPVVVLAVASLAGFDRVLLLRAALLRRPEVQAASVLRYADGEAELHLVLEQPRTPAALARLLSDALGCPVDLRAVDLAAGTVRAVPHAPPDAGQG
ncbi:MAG TPA: hypothetical protein VIO14_07815 [Dehalococcoidia bacterium]